MNLLFAAVVTFVYTIETGKTYQACYKPVGGVEVCDSMTATPKYVTVDDDTEFEFYMKVQGVASEVVRFRTAAKKPIAPMLSVSP